MKNTFLIPVFLLFAFTAIAQTKAEKQVVVLLEQQAEDWNKGDIDAFMEGYWKSEELQFIGGKGVTKGWKQTKENYKKGYPTKEKMGNLDFDLISVDQHSKKSVSVTGKFILTRADGEVLSGHFLLVVQKMKGKWLIVKDHTSV